MWKVIINSKSYKCEHNWVLIQETTLFLKEDSKFTYVCEKCCESKTIKI